MNTPKERPILVSGRLIRPILTGHKTQTRRLINPKIAEYFGEGAAVAMTDGHTGPGWYMWSGEYPDEGSSFLRCPFGVPGDRLWVRETWRPVDWNGDGSRVVVAYDATNGSEQICAAPSGFDFKAWAEREQRRIDNAPMACAPERPSIHMPRWASRISLEVVDVRVQRVQEISEEDARAEGAPAIPRLDGSDPRYYRQSFAALWDSLAPAGQEWADNPWVWAVTFKRVTP